MEWSGVEMEGPVVKEKEVKAILSCLRAFGVLNALTKPHR